MSDSAKSCSRVTVVLDDAGDQTTARQFTSVEDAVLQLLQERKTSEDALKAARMAAGPENPAV
ncbi:MAG: hypothetical protein ACK4FJ_17160 [Ferrovibrio sp.]|uniref:hypothetical protein n=1 Tax=Ferrovibrio sp. TaxID=1917215 RepID=UPI00391A1319